MKRILLEVNHVGQVHLFQHIYHLLANKGNLIIVTTKKNTAVEYFLKIYNIPYIVIGKKQDRIFNKILNQIIHDINTLRIVLTKGIELGIGSSITNDHVSMVSKMKSIHFSDDDEDVVPFVAKYSYPFTDLIISPDCLKFKNFYKKNIGYPGYHELAYLHPQRFTPDPNVLTEAGLSEKDAFFILRFNSFKAHHDKNERGISIENKIKLINRLKKYGKVLITTERDIEPVIERYQINIRPEKLHHFLAFATMFIGDSQTMASEAAVLGTPALKCNTFAGRLSVHNELESKYDLLYSYLPEQTNKMLRRIDELLSHPNLKKEWQKRRKRMLEDKIDVTDFVVWFIENYPQSIKICQDNIRIFDHFI